ncbi:SHOCT domain-containing protein [Cnuibacter sp. UC19_7]|uniref:SHOCT domain-containing protein n=1 Tax=Cnuibacter sp. UC19_7 TaxID=3350166 RepID=UPI003671B1E0
MIPFDTSSVLWGTVLTVVLGGLTSLIIPIALFFVIRRLRHGGSGGKPIADGVRGTAQVVSASMNHGGNSFQLGTMTLVISVPGKPAVSASYRGLISAAKWPMPGAVLPVLADHSDPRRFEILWDEVATNASLSAGLGELIAQQMNAASATPMPAASTQSARGDTAHDGEPGDIIDQLERLAALRASGALSEAEFARLREEVIKRGE